MSYGTSGIAGIGIYNMNDLIKSISYDQSEIIQGILKLYCKDGVIDIDPTYSKGVFYKNNGIESPIHKYDLMPQIDGVKQANCIDLPFEDSEFNTIMFDPGLNCL